jgi:outer membrane usher protein
VHIPTVEAADFSAYLNVNLNLEYSDAENRFENPDIFLFGATHFQGITVEFDGGFSDTFDDGYRFYRRSVRAVYDFPERHLRLSAGDLRLTSLPLLRTQFVGGVAIEKRREVFDPFQPITQLGGRRILIDSPSTVEILVGGASYRTIDVQPGVYDLADLPLQYGANDVQIVVRDAAGREQVTRFDYFFDPIDLAPGEEEFSAAVGFVSRDLVFEPDYGNDPAFFGFYRKAFTDRLALGGALQISEDIQVASAEIRVLPRVIPGTFDLQAATSFGDGTGFAFRLGYRWADSDPVTARRFSATVDYQSSKFHFVGDPAFIGLEQWTLSASYSQNFSTQTGITAGLTYVDRSGFGDQRSVFMDLIHRFNPRIRGSVGVEYGGGDIYPRNFGIRASISILFGGRNRADASYQSRREIARASLSRSVESHAGSWGYDLTLQDTDGRTTADATGRYLGNRFDARMSFITSGRDLGSVGDNRVARLQLGTTFAFADGTFGIGRTINDAFVLVRPHSSLGDRKVITGRELNQGVYEARSGLLGAAVVPQVASYNPQDVLYDVDSLEPGYDIGAGIVRVDLPYRGGAVVTVGTDRFVSVVGNLILGDGPAELITGTITSEDDPGFPAQPFFTNSSGRFGILGLAPGRTYTVRLASGQNFVITIPEDNTGLYRAGQISVPASE